MENILINAKEVVTVYTTNQVNKYLNDGWKLIYVGQHSDPPNIFETSYTLIRTE
nr:MAG TPA: protein of unknown function (DUF1737) [Caudoviricetes sp.]